MNALQMARTAYAPATTATSTPQSVEYDAFVRITSAMRRAERGAARISALHDNRSLWTLLAGDVADAENGLPPDLRARIFYLAEFTRQHTSRALAGDAEIDVLIEINTAMMRGLRGQAGQS